MKMKYEIWVGKEILARAPSKKEANRILKEDLMKNGTKTLWKIRAASSIVIVPIKKRS